MKPIEDTENFVRRGKAKVATDPQMDRRVLDDSLAAMDEAKGSSSAARMTLRSRAIKLAAAAVIIIAVGLLIIQSNPREPAHTPTGNVAASPTDMLSVMSLKMAYRRGGIEAMDDQSNEAFEMLGSQPTKVSIRELLTESNGV